MRPTIDSQKLLEALDSELSGKYKVIICGGLVIHTCYSGDASMDIDSVDRLQDTLKDLVAKVAASSEVNHEWFNDHASEFFDFDTLLPKGWRKRALKQVPVFSGKHISLLPLERRDLILTKLFAVFSRGSWEIMKDIKALSTHMKASQEELLGCTDDLFSMLKGGRWAREKMEIEANIRSYFK